MIRVARCHCCGSDVDIVARLTTEAGLPVDADWYTLQQCVSLYAYQRYQLFIDMWDNGPWDVCYRCYVFSGAEHYYPFSMCPQYRY